MPPTSSFMRPRSPHRCTTASSLVETIDANVNGLRFMLDYAAARQQAAREGLHGMLFFSTSEIYGDPPANEIPTGRNVTAV